MLAALLCVTPLGAPAEDVENELRGDLLSAVPQKRRVDGAGFVARKPEGAGRTQHQFASVGEIWGPSGH